uniref:Capsid protein n=1 Tax=Guangdong sanke astrovirus TaxID=2116416 RepID=A0A2P1GNB9_9VIRU|nr:capsid protein [Guangdong sanke astrovirus]
MEQRAPRKRSRSRNRNVVVLEAAVKSRSRSRSKGRKPSKGILKKEVKEVVEQAVRPKQRQQKKGKTPRAMESQIRSLKAKTDGPKVTDQQHLTLTMGMVRGQAGEGLLQHQFHFSLNPLFLKENDSLSASTPLADRAKNYAMWRPDKVELHFIPLVNASNITGSICIVSIDQDGSSAEPTNVDDLLARTHLEIPLGKRSTWKVPVRALKGPRQNWWKVNTNEGAAQAYGPSIDIHLYGPTSSLAVAIAPGTAAPGTLPAYLGSLWSVQLRVSYSFSTWDPKPQLGLLYKKELTRDAVTVSTNTDNELIMTVPNVGSAGEFNQIAASLEHHRSSNQAGKPGEILWSIADTTVTAASSAVPPPWGWLISGGWWIVRRIFGTSSNSSTSYYVYASANQAEMDQRSINPTPLSAVTLPSGRVLASQLNAPNVGSAATTAAAGYTPSLEITLPTNQLKHQHHFTWNDGGNPFTWETLRTQQPLKLHSDGPGVLFMGYGVGDVVETLNLEVGSRGEGGENLFISLEQANQWTYQQPEGTLHNCQSTCIMEMIIDSPNRPVEGVLFLYGSSLLIRGDQNHIYNQGLLGTKETLWDLLLGGPPQAPFYQVVSLDWAALPWPGDVDKKPLAQSWDLVHQKVWAAKLVAMGSFNVSGSSQKYTASYRKGFLLVNLTTKEMVIYCNPPWVVDFNKNPSYLVNPGQNAVLGDSSYLALTPPAQPTTAGGERSTKYSLAHDNVGPTTWLFSTSNAWPSPISPSQPQLDWDENQFFANWDAHSATQSVPSVSEDSESDFDLLDSAPSDLLVDRLADRIFARLNIKDSRASQP